ncbi:Myb-like_DNA-binding domain-containing protein [Hexamita inflata]|uniref:Myb-like DNA-binding domain-containing protein n=1 Tax=Hexamita inflata TaxID=28002 RepID=A0AA86RIA7_9EUKA|nr:Myb-like DNA-binding domain-containing protein [Hexamita inflata]
MKYKRWSEEEKELLIKSVKDNTVNSRTNWNIVATQLSGTPNQCKTYYSKVIQKQIPKHCTMKWTAREEGQLIACVDIHGRKWGLIQRLQFQDFTPEQVRQKFSKFENRFKKNFSLISMIKNGDDVPLEKRDDLQRLYKYFSELKAIYDNSDKIAYLERKAIIKAQESFDLDQIVLKITNILEILENKKNLALNTSKNIRRE